MKTKFLVVLLFINLILLSGCTDQLPIGQKYCSQIGLCKVEEKTVEVPDIIIIKDIKVLPIIGNQVKPNSEVDIIVTLENRDLEKPITLEEVRINPSIFNCQNRCVKKGERINPGQIKTFSFKIKAPNNEGTLALPAHLEVSVKYNYTSTRLVTITFINEDTFKEYIEGGGKIEVPIINVPSNGPVELYLDISKIYQPVILNPNNIYQIYLEVKNKGGGEVDGIEQKKLNISFEGMSINEASEEFNISGNLASNNEVIRIRGTLPRKYYFGFSPSDFEILKGQLTVTKRIIAKAIYTYRISKSIELVVSPKAEI